MEELSEMKFFDYVDADSFLEMLYDFPDELAEKVQGVFHLGACSSTTEMDMNFLMENNVNYSKAVFEFCSAHQVPLLYASSAATYGDGENGYDDESDISELKPLNPMDNQSSFLINGRLSKQ